MILKKQVRQRKMKMRINNEKIEVEELKRRRLEVYSGTFNETRK